MQSDSIEKTVISLGPILQAIIQLIFEVLRAVSTKYNIDYEEMKTNIEFDTGSTKKQLKNALKNDEKNTLKNDEKENKKTDKPKYPIPFCPNHINKNNCNSLIFNNGLFTQCGRKKAVDKNTKEIKDGFCSICSSNPENSYKKYGTLDERLKSSQNKKIGLYGYKTPLGEYPKLYITLLKENVTQDMIQEELTKFGITDIPNEHFIKQNKDETNTKENKKTGKKSNIVVDTIHSNDNEPTPLKTKETKKPKEPKEPKEPKKTKKTQYEMIEVEGKQLYLIPTESHDSLFEIINNQYIESAIKDENGNWTLIQDDYEEEE